jgi:hypothetical protein
MIDSYELAMLPVTHMLGRADPFDRYCKGLNRLDESYRNVVNNGIWLYQLHAYHALIGLYFGEAAQCAVHDYQRAVFAEHGGAGLAIGNAMLMIDGALGVEEVLIQTEAGEISLPVEMNVSLALLLNDPASPDYAETVSQREAQISQMGSTVDWCLARCLMAGRDEIVSIFSPMLAHMDLDINNGFSTGLVS